MKFPGLDLSVIPSANSITSAYVEIRDLMCETTNMTVYGYIFAGNDWTESSASWSNVNPNYYTEMPNAYADVNYSNGASKNPTHRYSLNITQAVKNWKTGFYSQSKGIMLKASDDVEYGSSALYKTFASYNRSSQKPSLKVSYFVENAALVGIPDANTDVDRLTVFNNITPYLQYYGITANIYHANTTAEVVKAYLDNDQNKIFVSRSHGTSHYTLEGTPYESLAGTSIILNSAKTEILSSSSLWSLDLSNLRLAVFVGCYTGIEGEGANNLPTVAVERGATTAIGFSDGIDWRDANRWTELLFRYLNSGKTVQQAVDEIESIPTGWVDVSKINSAEICGDRNTKLR